MEQTGKLFGSVILLILITMGPMWLVIFLPFLVMGILYEFGDGNNLATGDMRNTTMSYPPLKIDMFGTSS